MNLPLVFLTMVSTSAYSDLIWHQDLRFGLAETLEHLSLNTPFYQYTSHQCLGGRTQSGSNRSNDLSAKNESVPLSNAGIPDLSEIPLSTELSTNHPLAKFINYDRPLGLAQYIELLRSPHIDLSITGFHSGSLPAAIHSRFLNGEPLERQDYSRNEWLRDAVITAVATHRAGFSELANAIVTRAWHFLGSTDHRSVVVEFHHLSDADAADRFSRGVNTPRIKFTLDNCGNITWCDHEWGHEQIDAIGAAIWAPFRFANQRVANLQSIASRYYDGPALALDSLDPLKNTGESILVAYLKFLNRIGAARNQDFGPWEDFKATSRATSVGIVAAAAREAIKYHEREGWGALGAAYAPGQKPEWYQSEVLNLASNATDVLKMRVPESGYAIECNTRPYDSAMTFLLYPFEPGLNTHQQHTVLRTLYLNMIPEGFHRWKNDTVYGSDSFVGQDYFRNLDPAAKGEFADNTVHGYRPAAWTLFDPLLSAYYFRRFIDSNAQDYEAYLYGDRHMKRALSLITKDKERLIVEGKRAGFEISKGILPEARAWDSVEARWRCNHNSPLLMAQAALAMAFERASEASLLLLASQKAA